MGTPPGGDRGTQEGGGELLLSRSSPFVGRDEGLRQLGAALQDTRLGTLSGVVVSGAAGVGKSRLVAEFRRNTLDGVGVHAGGQSAPEDQQLAPLRPIREVLAALGVADVADRDGPTGEQEHRFARIADALRDAAGRASVLALTIEDLHWADTTSLQLLRYLARALADAPILLLVTCRDGHEVEPPLRELLTAWERDPSFSRIELGPLTRPEIAQLAERRLGRVLDDGTLQRLQVRSEGIPLFVEELVDALARGQDDGVPRPVRELFLVTLEGLDAHARSLVEHAAVCGSEFGHELLAEVAPVPPPDLEAGLDDLLAGGVLITDGAGYRFRHALLHETAYGQLSPAARRRLHRRTAQALAEHPHLAVDRGSVPAALAHHWREAGETARALAAYVAAADGACELRAYAEALGHELEACDLIERLPPEEHGEFSPLQLLVRAAITAGRAGDHPREVALLERALAATVDPAGRSALSVQLTAARYLAGDAVGAATTAASALDELPDGAPDAARALLLALSAHLSADPTRGIAPADVTSQALELARPTGDADVVCSVLCAHGLAQATGGDVDGARRSLDEAERLTPEVADPRTTMRPAVYRMLLLQRLGAASEVVHVGREAILRADRLGVGRSAGQQLRAILAEALVTRGLWDEAGDVIDDALAWGENSLPGAFLLLAKAGLALRRGDLDAADRLLTAVQRWQPSAHPRTALVAAELAWWRGDPAGSRVQALRGLDVAAVGGPDELGALTSTLARAVTAPGGGATEDERMRMHRTLDGLPEAGHPVLAAWRVTALAELAGTLQPAAWETARAVWRATGDRPMDAYASWRAGRAHLSVGDRDAAEAAFAEAETLAQQLGAALLLAEVRAASAAAEPGGDRAPARPAESIAAEAAKLGLSRREIEVLGLMAQGWTNKRIGAALSISPRTVGSHVSHILDKLGVTTRGEAVAVAAHLNDTGAASNRRDPRDVT